jgi:hypothetical protein
VADELISGTDQFTTSDLAALSSYVATKWRAAVDLDWSAQAGTVEWSCLRTADHAVDCVWAPAFFLASRRTDRYPAIGADMAIGPDADPTRLVESLEMGTRVLSAVIHDTDPDVRSVIFRRPEILVAAPEDFAPRGAIELILHAHDVCLGLGVEFEPDSGLCHRLREHTRPWPMWTVAWHGLAQTDDPWRDLLIGSGRQRAQPRR